MKRVSISHSVAFCGVVCALAILLGYLEHLIPFSVGIYGIKLGLANLSVLVLLYLTDVKHALTVHILRIALCGILFGNVFSIIYSFAGGLFSFLIMALLKKWGKFSPIGISVAGGVAHNIAQLVAAIFMVNELRIALYLPILLISGALAGLLVGVCCTVLLRNHALKNFCHEKFGT